ncbi:hypothetical protein HK097_005890, partial [Rhizophlyctis rosea]
ASEDEEEDVGEVGEGAIKYPDAWWFRRNDELHRFLKSVPVTDCVIDVFACALQKDIAVRGKVYVTQNRICFYSNLLGFINVLVVDLKEVTAVNRKQTPFYSSIVVDTKDASHTFKFWRGQDDLKPFTSLKAAWINATEDAEKGLSPQELFDSVSRTKSEDKAVKSDGGAEGEEDSAASAVAPAGAAPSSSGGYEFPFPHTKALHSGQKAYPPTQYSDLPAEFEPPPTLSIPVGEVTCGCTDHPEKKELDVIINAPAKFVAELVWGGGEASSGFWEKFHGKRGETGRQQGQWVDGVQREVKVVVPINNSMVKAKEAELLGTDHYLKRTEFLTYIIESRTQTPSLPYGDAFSPMSRYCITWVSKTTCRVVVHTGIKWFKNPMVKGIIKNTAMKELAAGAADMVALIQQEVNEWNVQTRGVS